MIIFTFLERLFGFDSHTDLIMSLKFRKIERYNIFIIYIWECFKGAWTKKINFCINVLRGAAIIFYRIQLAISFVLLVFSLCQFLLIMKTEFGRVQDFTCYTVSTDFQWFIFYAPVASDIVSVVAVSFFLLILFFNIFH